MREQSTMSLAANIATVDAVRKEALGLTPDEVLPPDMPVMVLLDELSATVMAVAEHMPTLSTVGVTEEMALRLERYRDALRAAQAICISERSRGRSDDYISLIEEAEALREEILDCAILALRKDAEGQRRLTEISEGERLKALISDLRNLAVLLVDKRALFEAIHINVDKLAAAADQKSRALQTMLTDEDSERTLVDNSEMRDRIFVLAKDALKEIRLFAAFAFRKDKSNRRRQIFTSAFMRRKAQTGKSRAAGESQG